MCSFYQHVDCTTHLFNRLLKEGFAFFSADHSGLGQQAPIKARHGKLYHNNAEECERTYLGKRLLFFYH